MRIGSREGASSTKAFTQVSTRAEDFGAGVGAALQRVGSDIADYGASKAQLENVLKEKKKANDRAKIDIDMLKWEGEEKRRLMDATTNVQPGAEGFTNNIYGAVEQSWEEFQKGREIPEELRDEYQKRFETFRQNAATTAFAKELEESDRLIVEQVNEQLDIMAQDVHINNQNFDGHYEQITKVIDESGLPPSSKEEAKQTAYNKLMGSLFESERIQAQSNQMPVRAPDGSDVVAPGLAPAQRGLLNAITAFESPGGSYNARFNGRGGAPAYFQGYDDHPRVFVPTGRKRADGSDEVSSAAGRYQFTATTWDNTMREMRAAGYEMDGTFSPVNQDRAAVYLAEQDFKRKTGLDLNTIINSGDREQLRVVFQVLNTTWEGLQPAYGGSFDKFANILLGVKGVGGGGTGTSAVPNVWEDPRYAGLDYATKMALETQAQATAQAQRDAKAKARDDAEQAIYDQVRVAFASGDPSAINAMQFAIDSGAVQDADRVVKMYGLMEEEQATLKTLAAAQGAINSGLPYNDEDGLDVYAERSGILAGVQESDPDAAAQVASIFNRTGGIPPNVLAMLESQFNSANPQQQQYAMQTLADLYLANPTGAMAAMSEKQLEAAALASTVLRNSPDAETGARTLRTLTDPATSEERKRLRTQAEESIEDMGAGDFFKEAFGLMERKFAWMGGGINPTLPQTPEANMQFSSDYMRLYKNHYAMTGGNEDMAHELTGKMMAYQWQPNPLTGEIMKFSPISPIFGNQQINGSYDWITQKLEADFPREEGSEAVRTFVSTPNTLPTFQRTGELLYEVIEYDERFGVFRRLGQFDARATEEMKAEDQQFHALENINMRIEAVEKRIVSERGVGVRLERSPFGGFTRRDSKEQELLAEREQLIRQRDSLTQSGPLPQAQAGPLSAPESSPNPPQRPDASAGPTPEALREELNALTRINTKEARERMQEIQRQLREIGNE